LTAGIMLGKRKMFGIRYGWLCFKTNYQMQFRSFYING
jgi:hypothetical protein